MRFNMKLGYGKLAMEQVPVATAIRRIADLGYAGIELDAARCSDKHLSHAFTESGVDCS